MHRQIPKTDYFGTNSIRYLAEAAREAGANAPERLARKLAIVFEGAAAMATSLDSPDPFDDARAAAAVLIDTAMSETT